MMMPLQSVPHQYPTMMGVFLSLNLSGIRALGHGGPRLARQGYITMTRAPFHGAPRQGWVLLSGIRAPGHGDPRQGYITMTQAPFHGAPRQGCIAMAMAHAFPHGGPRHSHVIAVAAHHKSPRHSHMITIAAGHRGLRQDHTAISPARAALAAAMGIPTGQHTLHGKV